MKEDRKLINLIEEIVKKLPEDLREEALEKGFMVKTSEKSGELQFGITVPDATRELEVQLKEVIMRLGM